MLMRETRSGGGAISTPGMALTLENQKAIGFLVKTRPDLKIITKLPSQHSMLGQYGPVSEVPFKWRFACGPMIAHF